MNKLGRPSLIPISVGSMFGDWLVVGPSSILNGRAFWVCRCLCTKEYSVSAASLRFGSTSQCRSCASIKRRKRKAKDISGKQHGGWTVLREIPRVDRPDKQKRCAWLCRCKCGSEKALSLQQFERNTVGCRSCAARSNGQIQRSEPYAAIFNSAKAQIANRGIAFSIKLSDFVAIVETGRCHYCHAPLSWAKYTNAHYNDRSYKLDRKNNNVGYLPGNVVGACKRCNYAKSDQYSYEEWWAMTAYFRHRGERRQTASEIHNQTKLNLLSC
jgi:hypothetical protein